MSKSKIQRCTAPHCRTLTSTTLCDAHQAADDALLDEIDAEIADSRRRAQEAELQAQERDSAAAAARLHRDALRASLADLQRACGRVDRSGEQPIFSGGHHGI